MGKKKKFIDKKNAVSFRVVHRHFQDPLWGTENRSDFVLEPINNPNALKKGKKPFTIEEAEKIWNIGSEGKEKEEKSEIPTEDKFLPVTMYEFPDDGYDYTKHLKPMGEGTFIPAVQSSNNLSAELFGLPPLIEDMEVKQSLQAGSEQFLPEDVLYLLENPDVVEENDLQDDFMIAADASGDDDLDEIPNLEGDDVPELEGDDDIPPLEGDEGDFIVEERYEDDGEDYSDLEDDFDDENGAPSSNAKVYVAPEKQYSSRMIDQQFDRFNEEFDEDDIGELDNEDPSIKGSLNVNDISSYLDEFLQEYRPVPLKPKGRLVEESDVPLLVHDVEALDLGSDSDIENEELNEKFVDYPYLAAAFKPKTEPEFDCESIISTYSNIYNHPTLVDELPQIKLSKKTGMPIGFVPIPKKNNKNALDELVSGDNAEKNDDQISTTSTNFGERRPKNETPEERKNRKKAIKEAKKERRQVKKSTKIMYKEETIRQVTTRIKTKNPTGIKL